ncbi:hypothetical protein Tco_0133485 [Tanacetum coccineum]
MRWLILQEELVIRDGMERIVFKPDGSQDKESIHMMDIYDDRVKDVCEPKNDDSSTSIIVEDFKTFSNPLFEKEDDFPSRNDESILKEEVHKETLKSNLNPLFEKDEEIISNEVESFERKTKEDFETKNEPEFKKELQVFHPDIETLNHFESTSYVGSDYVFYEDFNLVDMIFPMNIQGKIFDPGITFHGKSFEKDAFKDKSSKELAPSKALLTLDVFDPLHPPLMDFHVTKAFFGFTFSLLKIFSKKFFEPEIKNATVYLSSLVWGGFHLLEFLHPHYYPP